MFITPDINCYVAMRRMIEFKSEVTKNLQKSDAVSLRDNISHTLFKCESIILRYECHL